MPSPPPGRFARIAQIWHSFGFKFGLLLVIFLALPVLLFIPFRNADQERSQILIGSVRDQGRLIAEGVRPLILRGDAIKNPTALSESLARFAGRGINVRILFRPESEKSGSFFLVSAAPTVPNDYLETERAELARLGVFERLDESCQLDNQAATRYTNPKGEDEVLTSITPINLPAGCWVVMTAHRKENFPIFALNEPLWKSPPLAAALVIYALMAVVIASLFGGILGSLRLFRSLAREIRTGIDAPGTFEDRNAIPELQSVASEFDHMVHALRSSSGRIRQAAEENAHALKAPLAVISQSIEPLRKALPPEEPRAARALDLIGRSVDRLDALVSAARRMDEANAELVDPPRNRIDLSRLASRMAASYRLSLAERNIQIAEQIESGLSVLGGQDLLETIIENLLDNASGFAPAGSEIAVTLQRVPGRAARLAVEDRGPGVKEHDLDRIFQRYISIRQNGAASSALGGDSRKNSQSHFGIGLWIVRRNVEAMGGTIIARNREDGGLSMIVTLPTN
jgi:two-component system sensor histidine kinase ChvG